MSRGHPTQGGDDDLSLFRSKASRASGIIFSLAAALVIGWLGVVESIRIDLEEFLNRSYTAESEKAMVDIINQVKKTSGVAVNRENVLMFADDRQARAFIRADANYKEIQSRYKTVEPFRELQFLGFAVPIPWIAGAISWCLACSFLIFYINFKRQSLFVQLMNARDLYESKDKDDDGGDLRDFAGVGPFWLAPVYWYGENIDTQQKLSATLGWSEFQGRAASVLSFLFAIGMVLVMLRVVYVGFLITDDNGDLRNHIGASRGIFTWLLMVDIILIGLVVLSLAGLVAWFAGSVLVGAAFSDQRRVVVRGGAAFVAGSVAGALGLASFVGWPRSNREANPPVKEAAVTPSGDIARREESPRVTRGFYSNLLHPLRRKHHPEKTARVHYADADGRFVSLKPPSGFRIEATEDAGQIVSRLVFEDFTRAIEINYLESVKGGDVAEIAHALAILEEASAFQLNGNLRPNEHARPRISFRLLDLLARIYASAEQLAELEDLSRRAEEMVKNEEIFLTPLDRELLRKRATEWRADGFQAWAAEQPTWTFYVGKRGLEVEL